MPAIILLAVAFQFTGPRLQPALAQSPQRVIIDTDPGTDDALAILLALNSPELRVEALTIVAGNVTAPAGLAKRIGNCGSRRALRSADRDWARVVQSTGN